MLAGALGAHRATAMVLILDLWAWAIDLGNPDEPPTGDVPGTGAMSARMLAGAVEWTGDAEELVLALCACGLLEGTGDGKLRVRGMDRYRRTWEKNKRRKPADTVPVTGTKPATPSPVPARQTQTQTQTHIKPSSSGAKPLVLAPPTVVPPDTPPDQWGEIDFWAWAQSVRELGGYFAEAPPLTVDLERWWTHVLSTPGVSVPVLKEAFYSFGRSQHWEGAETPFPFKAFMKNWRAFLPRRDRAAS